MVSDASGASQHPEWSGEGSVSLWIGRSIDAHHRLAQCTGQMQRPGVAGHQERNPARKGDELRQGADYRGRFALGGRHHCNRQRLFAWPGIHQHGCARGGERGGNSSVTLRWPALGAPAGSGIDERQGFAALERCELVAPLLSLRVDWKPRLGGFQQVAGDVAGQLNILFDHMRTRGPDAL